MALAADIHRAWAQGGPKVLLTRSLRKIVRPAVRIGTLVFIECDLRKPLPERRVVPGIRVREATIADAAMFEDSRLFLKRMSQGQRCFMGIEETTGKLTNYRWINTSAAYIPELKRYLILKPGETYVYDLNTLPEFRRRGIDSYTRHYTYSYLRDQGYTKVYAYIHGDNQPSLNASRGFLTPAARVRYIQLRGCEPMILGRQRNRFPEFGPITQDHSSV
jgi:ribosomal protein S18 acetylase RimI-like enzyme